MAENLKPAIRFAGFTDAWEQRKVGDFYDFKNGLNKEKAFFGAGTPIVNFTDVFHKRGLRVSELRGKVTLTPDEISNYEVRQGDIFFTRTSETIEEIGYPSVMLEGPKDTVFSGFVLRGRAFGADPLALRFKQYAFTTEAFRTEMIKKSSMTTRALTSGTAIKRMYFQYPKSLEEQNCISAFFDCLDHLITLHQRECDKLSSVKKSMLDKMFPKNGNNVPEIRFAGFTDAWEQRKLGGVGKARSGVGFPDAEQGGTVGTPFFKVSDMNLDGNENEMCHANNYVSESQIAAHRWSPVTVLPAIFFAKVGAAVMLNRKRLCRFPFLLDNNTMAYSLSRNEWDADFAKALFETVDLTSLVQVGALPSYNAGDVEAMEIYLPSVDEQQAIGDFFRQLDHLITLHQRELEKLQNIKKSCLEKMFI